MPNLILHLDLNLETTFNQVMAVVQDDSYASQDDEILVRCVGAKNLRRRILVTHHSQLVTPLTLTVY